MVVWQNAAPPVSDYTKIENKRVSIYKDYECKGRNITNSSLESNSENIEKVAERRNEII